MERKQVVLVLVVVALVAVAMVSGGGPKPAAEQTGGTAAEQALAGAKAAGKPVLLSFRSNSCIPCKAMGEILAQVRSKYEGNVAFVDVSLEPDTPDMSLCEAYQIRAKPTTILLDADGSIVETRLGVWEPAELAARLDGLAGG